MRVPDEIRKSVLFIGWRGDIPEWEWRGTGYLIAVPDANHVFIDESVQHKGHTVAMVSSFPFMFLATARHVAEKIEGKEFALRTNNRDGEIIIIRGHPEQKWWYHPTERQYVDAAVTIFFPPNLPDLDIFWVDIGMFVDADAVAFFNLGAGDEVFMAGLFTKVLDTTKNIPIVRIGNLAMMPGEKIPYKDGKLIDAYLVESRSIGGLSGSPAFVRQTITMKGLKSDVKFNSPYHQAPSDLSTILSGVGRIFFLGSVIGHWDADFPSGFNIPEKEVVNMGISPIVPAHKIREIIAQSALQEVMQEMTKEMAKMKYSGAKEDIAPAKRKEDIFTQQDFEAALRKVSRKKSDRI